MARVVMEKGVPKEFQQGHTFLHYAPESWLLHTTGFEDGKSNTWNPWVRMLLSEQNHGQTPWTHE